jgi:hypothetical protein
MRTSFSREDFALFFVCGLLYRDVLCRGGCADGHDYDTFCKPFERGQRIRIHHDGNGESRRRPGVGRYSQLPRYVRRRHGGTWHRPGTIGARYTGKCSSAAATRRSRNTFHRGHLQSAKGLFNQLLYVCRRDTYGLVHDDIKYFQFGTSGQLFFDCNGCGDRKRESVTDRKRVFP